MAGLSTMTSWSSRKGRCSAFDIMVDAARKRLAEIRLKDIQTKARA
ncbi:hypothetical protein [Mesorhizobium sp.]|nr:hypothetical protein [Mesorhizobium sp.]